jgi:hypothetical protein
MEIILVDNASTDGSMEHIRQQFPDLHVVVNPKNLGYGGGNNRGVQEAKGEYIFVLNSDTEIEKQCQRWSGEVHPEGPDRGLYLFLSFPF